MPCGCRKFTLSTLQSLPVFAIGVYGLWHQSRCIYIGSTIKQSLRQRLMQHWNKSHNARLAKWIAARGRGLSFCYIEASSDKIVSLEKALERFPS